MIRLATPEELYAPPLDETGIRIQSLFRAYGFVPFIRFYSDGEGGLLSIMDGTALLSVSADPGEEWLTFLTMSPDIRCIHCSAHAGQCLVASGNWSGKYGPVLRYKGERGKADEGLCHSPSLPAVYRLLSQEFPSLPSLDAWYPDASHRIRHGCCHIACFLEGETVVSTAMTVAETDSAAILGQVATAASHRRQGLASRCIRGLIRICKVNSLYILPLNQTAEKLYVSLGFVPDGTWAELERV